MSGAKPSESFTTHLLQFIESGQLPRSELYACPYLPDRQARQQGFRLPQCDGDLYHALMDRGFRRTGEIFYSMDCPNCQQCVPIRVPVAGFTPSKSQRRTWRCNQDVTMRVGRPIPTQAKLDLHHRYMKFQHPTSDSSESLESFTESLYKQVVGTLEATYRIDGRLVGVTILDVCTSSVSSVYHFFDPDESARSLGVYSVLAEIAWARKKKIPHYYLGYWIDGSRSMQYKRNYRPHEFLRGGVWTAPHETA